MACYTLISHAHSSSNLDKPALSLISHRLQEDAPVVILDDRDPLNVRQNFLDHSSHFYAEQTSIRPTISPKRSQTQNRQLPIDDPFSDLDAIKPPTPTRSDSSPSAAPDWKPERAGRNEFAAAQIL